MLINFHSCSSLTINASLTLWRLPFKAKKNHPEKTVTHYEAALTPEVHQLLMCAECLLCVCVCVSCGWVVIQCSECSEKENPIRMPRRACNQIFFTRS